MSEPIYKSFKRRRVFRRNIGIVMLVLGVFEMILLRVHLKGVALWVEIGSGLAFLVIGFWMIVTAYNRPTREVLMLAQERRSAITPADLVTEMDLQLEDSRAILQKMAEEGLLQKADNSETYVVMGQGARPVEK